MTDDPLHRAYQDPDYLRGDQYRDSSNLGARAALHERFSTNQYGWFNWLFDQFEAPPTARVLELGCGPALLWRKNIGRIPAGWSVTLTDFSPGMVAEARQHLASDARFAFDVVDIQQIPYPDSSFDLVMAHHMLYHVPDLPRALREARRVLRADGVFYAATNGVQHLQELDVWVRQFASGLALPHQTLLFRLENGADALAQYFRQIEQRGYVDSLRITEVEPLMAYYHSMGKLLPEYAAQESAFRAFLTQLMANQNGALEARKATGVFVARP
jgi:ubiquinone/menaquinone biosynthesis C-methylase UbiE